MRKKNYLQSNLDKELWNHHAGPFADLIKHILYIHRSSITLSFHVEILSFTSISHIYWQHCLCYMLIHLIKNVTYMLITLCYLFFMCEEYPSISKNVHLSRRLNWAFRIKICPLSIIVIVIVVVSVGIGENFSHFYLLLQNHWTNFNQDTKHPWVKGIQFFFKWRALPFFKGRKLHNSKNTLTKLKILLLQNH